jgi:transcriptional regulator of arginine metabolism
MKAHRQSIVLEVVDGEAVTSQEQLRARLLARGIETTQATVSRDIRDLGLVKGPDGAYRRPDPPAQNGNHNGSALARAVGEYLRGQQVVAQMVVLKTDTGMAQPLAVALDRAGLPEVVGTIAGDDTVLVICRTDRDAAAFVERLAALGAPVHV